MRPQTAISAACATLLEIYVVSRLLFAWPHCPGALFRCTFGFNLFFFARPNLLARSWLASCREKYCCYLFILKQSSISVQRKFNIYSNLKLVPRCHLCLYEIFSKAQNGVLSSKIYLRISSSIHYSLLLLQDVLPSSGGTALKTKACEFVSLALRQNSLEMC